MITELPIEIQHAVYDKLDIKHRTMLNMALPKKNKITRTIKTNPTKDRKIKFLSLLMKRKRITKMHQLPPCWRTFVRDNMDDPAVNDLCESFFTDETQKFQTNEIAKVSAAIETLILHIKANKIDKYAKYLEEPIYVSVVAPSAINPDFMPFDLASQTASSLLASVADAIARYAKPKTFDTLFQNDSIFQYVIYEIFLRTRVLQDFLFAIINQNNPQLFKHIFTKYHDDARLPHKDWLQSVSTYISGILYIFSPSVEKVMLVCETPNLAIDQNAKNKTFETALERMELDTVDYLLKHQGVKHTL